MLDICGGMDLPGEGGRMGRKGESKQVGIYLGNQTPCLSLRNREKSNVPWRTGEKRDSTCTAGCWVISFVSL